MRKASETERNIFITGGAGFIGCNLAQRLLADPNARVRIFDNLSRSGVEHNLSWLRSLPHSDRLEVVEGDIRSATSVANAAREATEIYHLAAQVAVTTSIEAPRDDMEVNLVGTFNVLEAARRSDRSPFLLFTSTNKVYGSLHGVPVKVEGTRYRAEDPSFQGVCEDRTLDFHSPYGCSKGAADQYVHDYARIYGLPTVVFRMSCIAGPRQFGTEDQGWVAHFLYSILEQKPITIYGNGFQVRDILHVYDLLDAIEAASLHANRTAGQVYNLGGGPGRAVSVIEMLEAIASVTGVKPILGYSSVRPGDQPLYVSNTARLTAHTGWAPKRDVQQIVRSIYDFWKDHRSLLQDYRDHAGTRELVAEEVA